MNYIEYKIGRFTDTTFNKILGDDLDLFFHHRDGVKRFSKYEYNAKNTLSSIKRIKTCANAHILGLEAIIKQYPTLKNHLQLIEIITSAKSKIKIFGIKKPNNGDTKKIGKRIFKFKDGKWIGKMNYADHTYTETEIQTMEKGLKIKQNNFSKDV